MSKVVVIEFVSLDGVIQAPGNPTEDPEGFEHGGWSVPWFPDHGRHMVEAYAATDAFLLGRKTYEIFADYWPTVTDESDDIAVALNTRPKYVASTTLTEAEATWYNTTVIADDLAGRVAELRQQPGKGIAVIGSSVVAHHLFEHDLVDEYQLWVHPIVLGVGKKLFADGGPVRTFKHVDTATTGQGLVLLTYARGA